MASTNRPVFLILGSSRFLSVLGRSTVKSMCSEKGVHALTKFASRKIRSVDYASIPTSCLCDRQSTMDGHHRHSSGIGVFLGSVLT